MNETRSRILVGILSGIVVAFASSALLAQSEAPEPLTLRRAVELALERAPQLAAVRAEQDGERASAERCGSARKVAGDQAMV